MQAPYGTWRSPLGANAIAMAGRRVGDLSVDGSDLYWGETRPTEGGRVTIMRRDGRGTVQEVLAVPHNARTRVHEYGGGALLAADGVVYFSNFADQRLYRLSQDGVPAPVTAEGSFRYGDCVLDHKRNRLICVREDHSGAGHEPRNEIAAVDLASGEATVLASGRDFYASPRLDPDSRRLCWLAWDHPQMPWDGTSLLVADIGEDGLPGPATLVAGGTSESIYGPQWSREGVLHFVSDRSGWWNLYKLQDNQAHSIWPCAAEFGVPLWNLGSAMFGFSGRDLVCIFGRPGAWQLACVPADGMPPRTIELPYTELVNLRVRGDEAIMLAASPTSSPAILSVALSTGTAKVLRHPGEQVLEPRYVSPPTAVQFDTARGPAHAFYYAPHNPDYSAPPGELPPLVVIGHGGPTGSTSTALSLQIQYWTTRGIAVLDVNYGGSTGYGRAYRERLAGAWGVVDVEDCIAAAKHIAARGLADPARLVIRGGSAGGYTTLCALTFHDVFRAGASHYGIGDLEALAKDTHKFESRYLDRLIGPYPARRDVYVARSPIHHVDGLNCPVIFFQGAEDRVVPPAQAETMVAALRAKGLPVAYVLFEGEQHGFRRAENITAALEAELYFYGRVLGFTPADQLPPIAIENLS